MLDLKRPIIVLALLIAALVALIALVPPRSGMPIVPFGTSYAPRPTAESARIAAAPQSFSVLISFTDRGFEPSDITIDRGATIRFTNNSSGKVWIAATVAAGSPLYPGRSACGTSALDTCKVLAPHEFWEFTFTERGEWQYKDNVSGKFGVVRVK